MDVDKPTFDFSGAGGENNSRGAAATTSVAINEGDAAPSLAFPPVSATRPAEEGGYQGVHPIAAVFHVLFKLGSCLTFILGSMFSSSYVVVFVITVLFTAADFWTTKNITGRLLVSLRWWNEVKEDGSSQWIFESSPDADTRVNPYDSKFFWFTTAGYCLFWIIMCIVNLMTITRLPIAIIGLVLSGANILGYYKCQKDARGRVASFLAAQAAQRPGMAQQAVASFFGGGSNTAAAATNAEAGKTGP